MAVLNLQNKLYSGLKSLKERFFVGVTFPDYMISVGHFNREHGHHMSSWTLSGGIPVVEIFIDAMAFNKGDVYIWSILHHELVMAAVGEKGTGSFDSVTKAFADFAEAHGLAVYPTKDRFKFRSARSLEEHKPEWVEFFKLQETHPLTELIGALEAVIYPDLVSTRMIDAFMKAKAAGTFYPLPGGLLKPGTGGRTKKDYKFVKVKVTKKTAEEEVVSEAKNQYHNIVKMLDDDPAEPAGAVDLGEDGFEDLE